MAKGKSNGKKVPVSSLKHKDKRTNTPTRELQNFVKDEEKSPKTVSYPGLLYARDPSLDTVPFVCLESRPHLRFGTDRTTYENLRRRH